MGELVKYNENGVPAFLSLTADLSDVQEAMQANIGAGDIDRFSMPRIKVPQGDSREWRLPTLQGTQVVGSFVGLIVAWRDGRSFYKVKYGSAGSTNRPPDCSSEDAVIGYGTPGGVCAKCPLSKFGTGTNPDGTKSNAQACKHFRVVLVLREGSLMPEVLTVPPTSLKPIRQFFYNLASGGIGFYGTLVEFGIKSTKSSGGVEYAEVTFSQAGPRFDGDTRLRAKALSEMWMPVLAASASVMAEAGNEAGQAPHSDDLPDGLPTGPGVGSVRGL